VCRIIDEHIEEILDRDTHVVKAATQKNYNLRKKGPLSKPPSSKEDNISLRKITPPLVFPKQSNIVPEKTNNKIGKIVVANKGKPSTFSTTENNEKVIQEKFEHAKNDSSSHTLDYNVIEDMKKIKDNISMFDIFPLPQQSELLHDAFKLHETETKTIEVVESLIPGNNAQGIHKVEIATTIHAESIGAFSKS
jgi:hypothetical protein